MHSESMVVYQSQRVSGKYGSKVNGTQLFFQRKIYGSNGKSETVVLFFQMQEIRVSFLKALKAIFETNLRLSRPFLVNETDLYKW